jgi:aryl-alcohol dehydrogenase-like predicted oxidoreductase
LHLSDAMTTSDRSRREFLLTGAAVTFSGCARTHRDSASLIESTSEPMGSGTSAGSSRAIPTRALGKTGAQVSIVGIGGSHLGDVRDPDEAVRIVHEAIDAGITFFDNAWEYHDGKSEDILGRALKGKRDQVFLMTKVCTHGRRADVAMAQLEDSLKRLGTDHLDLWQVHECIYDNDPDLHFVAGGVIEALDRAKMEGKTRFVGFTGHKHPDIHLRMLAHEFAFDTAQMPINCFDATFRSFEQRVLPELVKRGLTAIGMKSLTGAGDPVRRGVVTAEEALRYAMSVPGIATTVSGVDGLDILRQNVAIARGFEPMRADEMQALRDRVHDSAADGRHELYKMTTHYDAKVGRSQHGYPSAQDLPL